MSLRQPAALLLVGDPQVHAELSAAAMTRRFGLTESEASLALDLLTGRSVAAIAAQRGRSVHTVRNASGAADGQGPAPTGRATCCAC